MTKPTYNEFQTALDVLMWLFEYVDDGSLRDEISHVRHELHNEAET